MPLYKFQENDLFDNRLKTYPSLNFWIYDGTVIYNNETQHDGILSSTNVRHISPGAISLYELNIDRPASQLIYPFITKDGSLTSFSTISTTNFNNDFAYGDIITGSYPMSASLSFDRFDEGATGSACLYYRSALKNTFNRYTVYSPSYAFSSSLGNKGTQEIKIISIPSIFCGSSIKRGSCSLKFYVSGAVIGELQDNVRNGELRQVLTSSGADSGSVAGVVLYDEGFIVLTGSWPISTHVEDYGRGLSTQPRWLDFGYTGSAFSPGYYWPGFYSSYHLAFSGTTYIPTLTMMAHAPKAELNYSNNPTFVSYGQSSSIATPQVASGSAYRQSDTITFKNIVKTNYDEPAGKFQKITYISKIGIYDKYKNLIAIANLPTPIRKREEDQYTFKLKLDF